MQQYLIHQTHWTRTVKRILLTAILCTSTLVAACGQQAQTVTRGQPAPYGFMEFAPDYNGATSTRSSIDLLSLG